MTWMLVGFHFPLQLRCRGDKGGTESAVICWEVKVCVASPLVSGFARGPGRPNPGWKPHSRKAETAQPTPEGPRRPGPLLTPWVASSRGGKRAAEAGQSGRQKDLARMILVAKTASGARPRLGCRPCARSAQPAGGQGAPQGSPVLTGSPVSSAGWVSPGQFSPFFAALSGGGRTGTVFASHSRDARGTSRAQDVQTFPPKLGRPPDRKGEGQWFPP
jgi:hypothetical protein